MDWIRLALQAFQPGVMIAQSTVPDEKTLYDRIASVKTDWIKDQQEWFKRKSSENQDAFHKCETAVSWLFGASIFVAALLGIALVSLQTENLKELIEYVKDYMIVISAMLLVLAGLIHEHSENRAYSVHAKKYEWMAFLFTKELEELDSILKDNQISIQQKVKKSQQLILNLGKECLTENMNWLLLHRERPVEMHKGS